MGMLVGVPLFVYGSIIKNINISTTGTLLALIISGLICYIGSISRKEKLESVQQQ